MSECFLLHPELIDQLPIGSGITSNLLSNRVAETLADATDDDENISLVIRTLNERESLVNIFEDLHRQIFTKDVEVIVVDNESSDGTPDVARSHGAEILNIPRNEFTYPKSMNLGVKAASHETVMLTVGHARLSNAYNLHAGARHLKSGLNNAGAFGTVLPNKNASFVEKLAAVGCDLWLMRPAHQISRVSMGVLGATNAVISKAVWEELGGFDTSYETGGEDTAMARQMLKRGYDLIKEPALTVHHSHGLGLINSVKQVRAWQKMVKGPARLDRNSLFERRPDLQQNSAHETE